MPPFDPGTHRPIIRFFWWSWHPNYPYWAKSCWGAETEEKAWEVFGSPFASSLRLYHNKLIREGDGHFTEVYDLPCERMDIWQKCQDLRDAK